MDCCIYIDERPAALNRMNSMAVSATYSIMANEDAESYKKRLGDEKKAIKKSILEWIKAFQADNGREPNKQEREALAGDMFRKYRIVSI
jgi:hypothetical protein